MSLVRIQGGRVIDPSQDLDEVTDVWLRGDRVLALGAQGLAAADLTIDARGKIVTPGLIDMHVHLCEPGRTEDETIATGTLAALAGGFTSVVCMPNTDPPVDNQAAAEFVHLLAARARQANVFPVGCVTKGRKGAELAEIGGLVQGHAVAFSDDDTSIASAEIMRRALEYCRMFDMPVLSHPEDAELTRGGVMHEGFESMRLGLRGLPAEAEEVVLHRDLELAELTGGRLHVLHLSTAGGVTLVRRAKKRGIAVTAEVTPHHLTLTDVELRGFDSNFKMTPPLRTRRDIEALHEGLRDGTIDAIASDHTPMATEKKTRELDLAPFGVIGLETLLPICITELIEPGVLTWPQLIAKLTAGPEKILRLQRGTLRPGAHADVTILDPAVAWTIDAAQFHSKSRNTPFQGRAVRGRATHTIVGGEVRYQRM